MQKGIVYDVRLFSADEKVRRNILGVRAAVVQEEGYVDQQSFSLTQGQSITIQNLPFNVSYMMHSNVPVSVQGTVPGNNSSTLFPPQTLFLLSCGLNGVTISNNNVERANIMLTRLSRTVAEYLQPLQLFTFPAFANIIPLGFAVTDINKLQVATVSFLSLTNNQVVAPSISATNLYRVCDMDGTPNVNGSYLMYLDSKITDANASGTLQLWIGELS